MNLLKNVSSLTDCQRLDWLEDLGNDVSKVISVVSQGVKFHDIRGAIDEQILDDKKNINREITQEKEYGKKKIDLSNLRLM